MKVQQLLESEDFLHELAFHFFIKSNYTKAVNALKRAGIPYKTAHGYLIGFKNQDDLKKAHPVVAAVIDEKNEEDQRVEWQKKLGWRWDKPMDRKGPLFKSDKEFHEYHLNKLNPYKAEFDKYFSVESYSGEYVNYNARKKKDAAEVVKAFDTMLDGWKKSDTPTTITWVDGKQAVKIYLTKNGILSGATYYKIFRKEK